MRLKVKASLRFLIRYIFKSETRLFDYIASYFVFLLIFSLFLYAETPLSLSTKTHTISLPNYPKVNTVSLSRSPSHSLFLSISISLPLSINICVSLPLGSAKRLNTNHPNYTQLEMLNVFRTSLGESKFTTSICYKKCTAKRWFLWDGRTFSLLGSESLNLEHKSRRLQWRVCVKCLWEIKNNEWTLQWRYNQQIPAANE